MPDVRPRGQVILDAVEGLVQALLWDDRRSDEELRRGDIEAAVEAGEVTVNHMVKVFRTALAGALRPRTRTAVVMTRLERQHADERLRGVQDATTRRPQLTTVPGPYLEGYKSVLPDRPPAWDRLTGKDPFEDSVEGVRPVKALPRRKTRRARRP